MEPCKRMLAPALWVHTSRVQYLFLNVSFKMVIQLNVHAHWEEQFEINDLKSNCLLRAAIIGNECLHIKPVVAARNSVFLFLITNHIF